MSDRPNVDGAPLTAGEAEDLVGATGQTIKNWVCEGRLTGYRIGNRIMIPKEVVAEYVTRGSSLDLEDLSDEEAARLVAEGRRKRR